MSDFIPYEKLSEGTRLRILESALSNSDSEFEDVIRTMKDLIIKECKKTISVVVNGVLTEVILFYIDFSFVFYFLMCLQVHYEYDGRPYYFSIPKEGNKPKRVYITGDSARASSSVKKQYRDKTNVHLQITPEKLFIDDEVHK